MNGRAIRASPLPGPGRDLPARLWLGMPVAVLAVQFSLAILAPATFRAMFPGELGVTELATPAMLVLGIVWGVQSLRRGAAIAPWVRLWITAVIAACVYFAGEELSWGQQLFGWATPEVFQAINDQGETNLHNASSWLDQKPRWLLRYWVLFGGILVPLWVAERGLVAGARETAGTWYWFWPTYTSTIAGVLALSNAIADRSRDAFDFGAIGRVMAFAEYEEFWLAMFLMLYLGSIRRRLRVTSRYR